LERLENVSQKEVGSDVTKSDDLDLVNDAIAIAIQESKGLRFDIKYRRLVLDWKDKESTAFDTLSDGQRGLVALIADIARRMALLNPQLGSEALSRTPGIVLIDELDMHLHPAWQRSIPTVLKAIFPKVQFIVASHSPQIIGELSPSEIWLMHGAQVLGHPDRSFGLSSNEVLEELMVAKARNTKVELDLQNLRLLIDNDNILEAQTLLSQLLPCTGELPELLGIQSEIRSLQLPGDAGE
jgi:predicted ATP-binding protein involved in virulence